MVNAARKWLALIGSLGVWISASSVRISNAADSRPAWQMEWEKTVKAAEEEGALVIYMTQAFEPVFREVFQKKFPKIKVTLVTGRGPDLSQRVMSERRAERFAVDLYVSGNISPLTVFHNAKILEPVKPLLLLPEVLDTSVWYEGKHHYDDPENRFIFVFEGTPRSGEITYNTKLVNPTEIKSYWDLLTQNGKASLSRSIRWFPVRSARRIFSSTSIPISARSFCAAFTPIPRSPSCAPMSRCSIG